MLKILCKVCYWLAGRSPWTGNAIMDILGYERYCRMLKEARK